MGDSNLTCTPCCSVPETTQVPGVNGAAGVGTNGTNGINASSLTQFSFVVPVIGNTVTISFFSNDDDESSSGSVPYVVGEPIFIPGAGTFTVSSKPNVLQIVALYLNYSGNTFAGATIAASTRVVATGFTPAAQTVLPLTTFYGVSGSQNLTNAAAQILSSTITLAATQTYLLFATARFGYVGATFPANQTLTVKIRRTNNSAADITNAVSVQVLAIVTTITYGIAEISIPLVSYSATATDILQIYASLSATPSAGNVQAVECSLVAMPVS